LAQKLVGTACRRGRRPSWPKCWLASVQAATHQRGILHRDLNPAMCC